MIRKTTAILATLLLSAALCPSAAFASNATWDRLAGSNALGTMYEITETAYDLGACDTVIVATVEGYWDALTAAGLAGQHDCPVLITDPYALSDETRYQIARIGASHAIIAGGSAAVSYTVERTLQDEMELTVERAAGSNAADTAVRMYQMGQGVGEWSQTAVVATGSGYWDAMSISPYAFCAHAPIFLSQIETWNGSTALDDATLSTIRPGGFTRVIICGGPAAVSSDVEAQLSGLEIVRLQGATAIETSQDIANFCVREGMQPNGMAVATIEGYWDGLVGAPLCGRNKAPLILARPEDPSTATNGFVSAHANAIEQGYVLGGTSAVPDAVKSALEAATK